MKNKVYLMVGLLAFFVIMIVAMILYEKLGSDAGNGPVMVESSETVDAASDSTATEDTTEDSTAVDSEAETDAAVSDSTADTGNSDSDESVTGESASDESTSDESMAAPEFTVYDADGNPVQFSSFVGKPIILNFWASWCGPCKNEMPDFNEAYREYGEDIHFLMVNQTDGSQETVTTATAFIEDAGYSFPIYYDSDMNAASVYGVSAIPMTFFIDAEGYLVAYAQGTLSADGLAQGISMILE